MAELEALHQSLEAFESVGARVVGVCPQLPEHNREMQRAIGLGFELMHDPQNVLADGLGIVFDTPEPVRRVERSLGLDLPRINGSEDWRMPMPARIVLCKETIIHDIQVQTDHTRRTEPSETLAFLERYRPLTGRAPS